MSIDWHAFTPLASLAGGLMIGLAAAVFILFSGRIAGISGVVGGLLTPARGDIGWRLAFLAGLIGAPLVLGAVSIVPPSRIDAGYVALIVAGLLVGAGTSVAAGCTSGHGICGLARMSQRSAVATAVFMGAGFLTVYLGRHFL